MDNMTDMAYDSGMRRATTTEEQRDRMLHVLLRNMRAFDQAREVLLPEHFSFRNDQAGAALWEAALQFAEAWGGLLIPDREWMLAELSTMQDGHGSFLSRDIDKLTLASALDNIYDTPEPTENLLPVAIETCRQFLLEYEQHILQESIMGDVDGDLISVLRDAEDRICAVQSIGAGNESFLLAPEDWEILPAQVLRPTNIPFLDYYLDGGDVAGEEVNSFMGPYGSCKSLLSCMLTVESARVAAERHFNETGSYEGCPLSILVTWEEPRRNMFNRCQAYAGRLRLPNMAQMTMSTPDTLAPYELEMQQRIRQENPDYVHPCELERARAAYRELTRNVRVIDFSGETANLKMYAGDMHRGIEIILKRILRLEGDRPIERVIIDYAGAAVREYCTKHDKDLDRNLKYLLGSFGSKLKRNIALPFHCSVWVMHQLSTVAASRKAGVLPSMTDSAECKSFNENINNAFAIGTVTDEGLCALVHTKHRRGAPKPARVIRINGLYGNVVDTNASYEIVNSKIISRMEAMRFSPATAISTSADDTYALFNDADGIGV